MRSYHGKTTQAFVLSSKSAHTWLIYTRSDTASASIELQYFENSGREWVVSAIFLHSVAFLDLNSRSYRRSGNRRRLRLKFSSCWDINIHYHRWDCRYKGIKRHLCPSALPPPAPHYSYLRYPTIFHHLTPSIHIYYAY